MNAADSSCKACSALLRLQAWGLAHNQDSSVSSGVNLHPSLLGTESAKGRLSLRVKLFSLQKCPNYAGWRLTEDLAEVI